MIAVLKSEFPEMQITVLTAFRDFDYAQRAIRLGVCRYLLNPSRMDELHKAMATMVANLSSTMPAETPNNNTPRPLPETAMEMDDDAGCFVVLAAMRYIEDRCAKHLSLTAVAEHMYVSQWHRSKLISCHAHQSFFDVLNHCRIQHP